MGVGGERGCGVTGVDGQFLGPAGTGPAHLAGGDAGKEPGDRGAVAEMVR